MKVVGYGWIKSGDTLKKAMEKYGVSSDMTKEQVAKAEKMLAKSINDVRKEFKKSVDSKHHRKSAKPRFFRVVLEEVGQD